MTLLRYGTVMSLISFCFWVHVERKYNDSLLVTANIHLFTYLQQMLYSLHLSQANNHTSLFMHAVVFNSEHLCA